MGENRESETKTGLIPIFVMGKKYMVPERLTIMKAMEGRREM